MTILGIETSCDETGAAIVDNGTIILSNIVSSSQNLHIKSGGIIPEVASREQIRYLIPVVEKALKNCQLKIENIDSIAVTIGPGLVGSLLIGVESAKTLAYLFQKPIIPVNHLLAHLYANWASCAPAPSFPAIALIVSGGHTDLLLMENHAQFRWLGGTRDDAAGEAFDKTARLLNLAYPGGPAIAAAAEKQEKLGKTTEIRLPRPMIGEDNFDFSFSGLKTAVLREVNGLKTKEQFNDLTRFALAHEIQEAITDVLVKKTIRAAENFQVKTIILGGGVAANKRLRQKFTSHNSQFAIHLPSLYLCTDNAATIASYAYFNNRPRPWFKIEASPQLFLKPRTF